MEDRDAAPPKMTSDDAERTLREIFRDDLTFSWGMSLCVEQIARAVHALKQYPELAKNRNLCRRENWVKQLPLAGLLLHGRHNVSVEHVRDVYHMYPNVATEDVFYASDSDKTRATEEGYEQGTIYLLHIACKYAKVDVIEFLARAFPGALSHGYREPYIPYQEWLPVQYLLQSMYWSSSPDFPKAMNLLLDLAPDTLLRQAADHPAHFLDSFFHTLIRRGRVIDVKDILQRKRLPTSFCSFFWHGAIQSMECVQALALVLPLLKSFRFCLYGPSRDHVENTMSVLQEELVKCQNLERFQVSWECSKDLQGQVDALCLQVLPRHKNLRELIMEDVDRAIECVRLVEYAKILEHDNTWTCVTFSYNKNVQKAVQWANKNKDVLQKIHFFSFWNKHGRGDTGSSKSLTISHLAALDADRTPQLNDELRTSLAYEILRATPSQWVPHAARPPGTAGCKRSRDDEAAV